MGIPVDRADAMEDKLSDRRGAASRSDATEFMESDRIGAARRRLGNVRIEMPVASVAIESLRSVLLGLESPDSFTM